LCFVEIAAIDYKYVPMEIKPFQLIGYYRYWDKQHNLVYSSTIIDFPEKRVNYGGYGIGVNFGFHF